ncbi:uncharacterized protein SCHCODRAFT_01056904, partial [Schizophyllum commune H4-8]|uniref:uncharacterized protein n=1 Tax=Schizophyllum commune (strain H4-8 / FGSC 9210) TaxID=578458 RepID=UPI00216051CC
LGHTNVQTIINMAKGNLVEGMPIDLSLLPPTCSPCIKAKQARTPVPKTRQGPRATRKLDVVAVDLIGEEAVRSIHGNYYSMHIVCEGTSMMWAIPLKTKDEALPRLQEWEQAR